MALGRKKTNFQGRSLIASAAAANLELSSWSTFYSFDSSWQQELWRLYDCVPEFSRGANYVGQACSRVRIYVAEVDENGQIQSEVPPTDPIGRLAYNVLGGPERQADLLRLAGIAQIVSGEFWIIALDVADDNEDKWFVVQYNELRTMEPFFMYPGAQPQKQFAYNFGDKEYILREGRDIIFRVWTPHPRYTVWADSPGRTLQMTLVELEILTQYILAQARSRLASGGVWPWPSGAEYPTNDGEPVNAEALMQRMYDAAKTNLDNFGSAGQLLPIIVELPDAVFDRIKDPIMFGSILSEQAAKLREECRSTIAHGLEISPEIITGMGDSTHWNGPMIEQSTVDSAIVPIMTRIVNALTQIYLVPALKLMGKNPKKFRFWFDTASLINRPNRLKETLELYQQGVVTIDEVLKAADLPESAKMGDEEQQKIFAQKLLLSDTNLLQIPAVRKMAGLNIKDIAPDGPPPNQIGQPAGGIAGRAPAPPPPPRTLKNINPTQQPERSILPGAPNNAVPGTADRQLTASTDAEVKMLVVGADIQVRQALEKVGKALKNRPGGMQFKQLPDSDVYLSAQVTDPGRAKALLASGFGYVGALMESLERPDDAPRVRAALTDYCAQLITTQQPHDPKNMWAHLEECDLL